jgi:D-alanine-D-alanine ligase-like ATP-grasp enzyme
MMSDPTALSLGGRYLRAAARARGWELSLHPEGGFAGQVRLHDGTVRYFVRSTLDINRAAAALVARDKGLAKFYLAQAAFPVIPGETFYANRLSRELRSNRDASAARIYADHLGYPVMVKPNSGAGGNGIERVIRRDDLPAALTRAFEIEDIVLIESYVAGLRDFRILVLDGEVLLAYERRPLSVTTDGRSSLRQLVDELRLGPPATARIERTLAQTGRSWTDVPEQGTVVPLLEVANLTQGGLAQEVTTLHPVLAGLAAGAAREIGLRYCGVDILASDAREPAGPYYVVELNASPTVHNFSAQVSLGNDRLLALHDKLLLAMVRNPL